MDHRARLSSTILPPPSITWTTLHVLKTPLLFLNDAGCFELWGELLQGEKESPTIRFFGKTARYKWKQNAETIEVSAVLFLVYRKGRTGECRSHKLCVSTRLHISAFVFALQVYHRVSTMKNIYLVRGALRRSPCRQDGMAEISNCNGLYQQVEIPVPDDVNKRKTVLDLEKSGAKMHLSFTNKPDFEPVEGAFKGLISPLDSVWMFGKDHAKFRALLLLWPSSFPSWSNSIACENIQICDIPYPPPILFF